VAIGYAARLGELVFLGVELVWKAEVVGYSEVAFLEAPERIVTFLQRPGLYKHRGSAGSRAASTPWSRGLYGTVGLIGSRLR
jgi:hypothetical protein